MNYIVKFFGGVQVFITIIIYYYYIVAGFIMPNFWGLTLAVKITIAQFFITIVISLVNYLYNKKFSWFCIVPFIISIIPLIIISIFTIDKLRAYVLK